MMAIDGHPTAERREAKNARYHDRRVGAGIAKMIVMGPAEHIPELRPILLNWRRDAKLLLESDLPSAGQVLADPRCVPDRFGPSCRSTLSKRRRPPRHGCWRSNPRPGARRVHVPKRRSQP